MILLQISPELKGDSKTIGHTDWITIDSFQFGVGRAISISGSGADRDTSNPSFSEISITKSMDIASTQLMAEAMSGKSLTKAVFHWIQTAGSAATAQQTYLEISLFNPIISSYSMSSGGERPMESITIHYNAVLVKYNQYKEGGTVTAGTAKGFDLRTNLPISALPTS